MASDWEHVAHIATVSRNQKREIRVRLLESENGCALEIREYKMSREKRELIAAGFSMVIFADRIPELVAALDKGWQAANALRPAGRKASR